MARVPMTRNDLHQIDQQIIALKKNQQALALLLSKQIAQFYERARHELGVSRSRIEAIMDKYVQKNRHGAWMTEEGEMNKYLFITDPGALAAAGILDVSQVEQKFNEAIETLMRQSIVIEW